ncbi:MAG: bioC [Gammaproteobacteria bacterium]|jgi:malonyl-CoA O-methyltransferase|nr:bioC [Gammaproteobacteria bacterium]
MPLHAYQHQLLKAQVRHLKQYQNAAPIIQEIGERLVSRLAYFRYPPQTICDLGAGQGIDTKLLNHVYPSAEVAAVDFSLDQLKQIPKNHQCYVAEATQLPFPAAKFDLVFANLLMPAIMDYPSFWQEVIRILKPGGIFLFSSLGPSSLHELRSSLEQAKAPDSLNTFIDMHDIGDGLVKAGFKDPAIDADILELHYSSLKTLLAELKSLGSIKIWQDYPHLYSGKTFWQQVENFYRHQFTSEKQKLIATLEIYFGIAFAPNQTEDAMKNISIPIASIKRR